MLAKIAAAAAAAAWPGSLEAVALGADKGADMGYKEEVGLDGK